MRNKPIFKWIGIVLCLISVVVLLVMTNRIKKANEAEREEFRSIAQEYDASMRPLWNEKSRLEREINQLQKDYQEMNKAPAPVVLLCSAPDADILEDIFPILEKNIYPAVIAIGEDAFPGNTDCLSVREVNNLCASGWELALRVYEDTDISGLYKKITSAGLPKPVAAYFTDDHTEKQIEQLSKLGISYVICYGKSAEESADGVWYLTAYGSNSTDVKNTFVSCVRNSIPIVLTVGYQANYEKFVESNYSNMIKTVQYYEKSMSAFVGNLSDAYKQEQANAAAREEAEAIFREDFDELQAQLDEVNAKIITLQK